MITALISVRESESGARVSGGWASDAKFRRAASLT